MSIILRWWRVHFLLAEFGIALVLALAFGVWTLRFGGNAVVNATLAGSRSAVYAALASIFGSLLGFTLAAVAIVLGYAANDRLGLVRDSKHYATLWHVFIAAMRALAAATLVALLGLIVDHEASPLPLVLAVCVGTTALALLRLARCLWVFEQIIQLVTAPAKSRREPLPGD